MAIGRVLVFSNQFWFLLQVAMILKRKKRNDFISIHVFIHLIEKNISSQKEKTLIMNIFFVHYENGNLIRVFVLF